jgi:hypothetical protein
MSCPHLQRPIPQGPTENILAIYRQDKNAGQKSASCRDARNRVSKNLFRRPSGTRADCDASIPGNKLPGYRHSAPPGLSAGNERTLLQWPEPRSWDCHSSTIATGRHHPALARFIFTGKQQMVNPCERPIAERLANFSIWQ